MRAIATDLKVIVGRLGPVPSKALEGAIRLAVSGQHGEVTTDHLLRALMDLPDCDLCTSMAAKSIDRKDVVPRLDWHLGRLPGKHEGKPRLSHALCLLLEDAGKLTTDPVRSGHVAAALLAAPSLSAADIAALLGALPKVPLHLLTSRTEDRGEVGRVLPPGAPKASPADEPPAAPAKPAEPVAAASKSAPAAPAKPVESPAPKAAESPVAAPKSAEPAPAASKPVEQASPAAPAEAGAARSPANLAAIRELFADRLVADDARGLTLTARVEGQTTTMRIEWDTAARVLVLRIVIPGAPPADAVRTAVALSTLNNALPHGTFIVEGEKLLFRSHVFLDAEGAAPLETLAFATRTCEEAAEAFA